MLLSVWKVFKLLHWFMSHWGGKKGLCGSPGAGRTLPVLTQTGWPPGGMSCQEKTLLLGRKFSKFHLEKLHQSVAAWLSGWDVIDIFSFTLGWFYYWMDTPASQISVCLLMPVL